MFRYDFPGEAAHVFEELFDKRQNTRNHPIMRSLDFSSKIGNVGRPSAAIFLDQLPKTKKSLRKKESPAVLGVMILDPDPKVLLEFAKAMAKRRPNDPLVIFDLYGNVFYP